MLNRLFENLLLILLVLPLAGAIVILVWPHSGQTRQIGLSFSLLTFFCSIFLFIFFDKSSNTFQWVVGFPNIPFLGVDETTVPLTNINFYLGIDGLSLHLVLLTTFLIPVCILCSWPTSPRTGPLAPMGTSNPRLYLVCLLVLETLLILVFCILDLILFYICFEAVLIPMFLLIGIWGSRERKIRAAYQFFLYTLLGSLLMLLAILLIYFHVGTTDLQILYTAQFSQTRQILLFLAFFASFAVKIPMIPFHIWLPEAHVEAPTAGSVILAGILLKLGGYGFLRFSIPLFPDASVFFTPFIWCLSTIAIIYASLTTLRQVDLKKIIAYSSVAHMNFVTIGMFTLTIPGTEGSIFLMLSHGIVSSALFLCVGVLYDRHHTRFIKYYSGLIHTMPLFSLTLFVFTLANLSLPGTSSFVGEFLILVGAFQVNTSVTFFASTGMVLGAAYSIWLYNRIIFGGLKTYYVSSWLDINRREFFVFLPFVILVFLLGIWPNLILDYLHVYAYSLLRP